MAGIGLAITHEDQDATALRRAASRLKDARQSRRLLAIALVLDGYSREEAAALNGFDRQTLRDWVIRYNEEGIDGLLDRPHPGRPARLTPERKETFKAIVVAGPDPLRDGVVRWRCEDLRTVIKKRFDVTLDVSTIGKLLRKLGLRRLSSRPAHPKKDASAEPLFKKHSPTS
jgi:transposase